MRSGIKLSVLPKPITLRDESHKFLGQRCGKSQVLAVDGMAELEGAGVETETLCGIAFRPVFFVAYDWTTCFGKLDSNLVAAAGFKCEFHKGSA